QPVWPFPWRLSAWAFRDPDFRYEAVLAVTAVGCGWVIAIVGLVWRRIRWSALVAAAIVVAAAVPHLDVLVVAAYPTSFVSSPSEFAATSIARGERLFAQNCATCHGADARGDGPASASLPVRPADLTAAHFLAHSDGELYWFIQHGFTAPDGATTMPGFARSLSAEATWHLIDYLHAHAAGDAMRKTGRWPLPIPMPQFDAQCADGRMVDLDDLRGHILHIVALSDDETEHAPAEPNAVTIFVSRNADTQPTGDSCIASEPQVWAALAVIIGTSTGSLAGTQLLVDHDGWLRATWRHGDPDDWTDPSVLEATVRDIVAHPIVVTPITHHH
ncbi:MAG TPA: cytochrome c, partial [Ktedonobacterales bacterium]|nr:cytochrome c [Ktedonobacterales bacterium]